MAGPPLRTSCGGGPVVLRKDLGAKPLASPMLTSLAAATGTYALESRRADSCFLLVGALARLEHFLEAGIGCVLGLGGAGFFVFEDWF